MKRRDFITTAIVIAATAALPKAADAANPQKGTAMTAPANRPASNSGYAPVVGGEVYYAVYGEGDPLVLLHGGLMTHETFGPTLARLAGGHKVIGIDLQSHGRTLPLDRPMSYEAMADDVASVLGQLGIKKADVMGYSLGGGTALRLAIQHPKLIDRLIVVSTPFAWAGWHDYNAQGMRSMSGALAEGMKGSPLHDDYLRVAPDPANFPVLLDKIGQMMQADFDWSAEVKAITAPTMLIYADWDAVRTAHIAAFFELLGGGRHDAQWDGSGMNANRLAILPGATHYTIGTDPRLAETVIGFIHAKE
jgi:pimeloyl-ACP methyl ester carboxylesterase